MMSDKRFHTKRFLFWNMIFLLFLALGVWGCNSGSSVTTTPISTTEVTSLQQVDIQLPWIHSIEYSGFYMAQEHGEYAEEGLEINLIEFDFENPDINPIDQVANGEVEFGVAGVSTLLLARAEGKPVVAVATIYQRSPSALISLAKENIVKPEDLVGKNVMIDLDGLSSSIYIALIARQQGIEVGDVNIIPRTEFGNGPLFNGEADVIDAFITNQPVQLESQGYEINAILPSEYGVDMYANAIFTTEDRVANNPELVEKFLRATIQGMERAVENPDASAILAVERGDGLDLELETESMRRSLPLINPAGGQLGMMSPRIWELAHDILVEQDILEEPLEIEEAYTLEFLEKIHSE